MRVLLDAHTVIWAVDNPERLGTGASDVICDIANELLIGAGTIWEIAIKVSLGKLELSMPFEEWMQQAIVDLGATQIPISIAHAADQMRLAPIHRDPFDRLLAAQSQLESATIVSADSVFDRYGVLQLW